jgi:hypothetical protein
MAKSEEGLRQTKVKRPVGIRLADMASKLTSALDIERAKTPLTEREHKAKLDELTQRAEALFNDIAAEYQ